MKKLLLIVAIPIVLVIGVILALTIFVNPNQFKPLIVEQVQKQTGLTLVIEGELNWQFFPSIGLELGKTELRNPQGFSQPNLFKVDTVSVDVSVTPLFRKQLEIGNVTLDGAQFYLETKQDGSKNIDALTTAQPSQQTGETQSEKSDPKQEASSEWGINLAGVTLSNGSLEIQDKQAGSSVKFYDITFNLSEFAFDNWTAVDFALKGSTADMKIDIQGSTQLSVDSAISKVLLDKLSFISSLEGDALPQSPMKVDMRSDLSFDLNKQHLNFVLDTLTANTIKLDGEADVTLGDTPKVRFALRSPNIDLDEFLGSNQQEQVGSTESESGGANKTVKPEVEPDLSALNTVDLKGDITIDNFKAANAKMQAVKAGFTVNRGVAELTSFSSQLYQGTINAKAQLDARQAPATYTVQSTIKGVKVQPLLVDVASNDKLEGTGNIDINVKGSSLTSAGIKKNLSGSVDIDFADGAVNGINIAQLIRENYVKFKGQKVEGTTEVKKTDFSAMTATLKLNKGWVTTDNMQAQSPLLRVRGKGKANYINETVDFTLSTSIVGTLEGQGGKDIDELKDITIPINVSGKWAEPKFKLVFDDVLQQKAKKEIDRGVEKVTDKIKDEKTKEAVDSLIKGLFN